MSLNKNYENIFSLIEMFSTKEKVCEFFTFFSQNTIRECKRIKKSEEQIYYPIIYSKEHETLSISFNFFIECIAKFYDPGNAQAEEMICADLKIGQGNSSEYLQLHNNRTLILINILQDYYGIVHPNNRRINATKLKGFVSVKDSYYIPIVYENEKKEPIQYETIPLKVEKLIKLGVGQELVENVMELGFENKLKDVAFNQRAVNTYWENSQYATRKRYE
jgi:hypothetical protein